MKITRRQMMAGGASAALLGAGGLAPRMARSNEPFHIISRRTSFDFGGSETPGLISLADHAPPPVLRMRQGDPVAFDFTNGLDDYTTMHWHGIRLPNDMDGVPYLTQLPIAQNETFRYAYTPPDAGTYWYHPHCMTMEQMAQGLTGILIVEEREDQGFDADLPLNLKDFRIADDGALLPYFTPRGASRSGTFGNVRTTNWRVDPVYDAPAGGLVRLRIAVTDTTRIHKLIFPDVPGRIIAWDGHPVEEDVPWPTMEAPLLMGPGQRVDVALVMPAEEGRALAITSLIGKRTPFNVVRLRATGPDLGRSSREITPLPKNPFGRPDLTNAKMQEIVIGWSPEGDGQNNGLCGTFDYIFWSINRSPWPGDAVPNVGPVFTMEQGQSYVLRLRNESPNVHPIHLHGLVFKPIASNLRKMPANYTDTVLLLEGETMDVVTLADAPGDWAFHCHIIEHQKTGLSGYIRVA